MRCRNGETKRIRIRAQTLCDNTHYLTFEDYTELRQTHDVLLSDMSVIVKKSEELKVKDLALASLGCAVAITGVDGCITYVNPAFISLWGFGSADEVSGRDAAELWGGTDGTEPCMPFFRSNQAWSGVLTGFRKDGSAICLYGMLRALRDANGQVVGTVGSFMDHIPADREENGCIGPG